MDYVVIDDDEFVNFDNKSIDVIMSVTERTQLPI